MLFRIAKGGKSTIQSCMDLYLGRKVCHKSLGENLPTTTSSNVDSTEADHRSSPAPNIVPTYDLGRTRDDGYFFTMKLLEGYRYESCSIIERA